MGPKRWSARREGQVQVRKGDEGEKEVVEDEWEVRKRRAKVKEGRRFDKKEKRKRNQVRQYYLPDFVDFGPFSSNYTTNKLWGRRIQQLSPRFSLGFPKGHCALWVCHKKNNVPFGSTSKPTYHLNYLNYAKTVLAPNIELSEHWLELKCLVDSGTHATNVW